MSNPCQIPDTDGPITAGSRGNVPRQAYNAPMADRTRDVVFVGGGLAALLLLTEMRDALPGSIVVIDPSLPHERPTVHWSYWSRGRTPYDRFAIGSWNMARLMDGRPEPIAPYTMKLVRSSDVLTYLYGALERAPIEWIRTEAHEIRRLDADLYEVATADVVIRTRRVFDSVPGISPAFPATSRPSAVLNGTGIRVHTDRGAFDPETVTLLDPIDEESFAYVLPLSRGEALVESACFSAGARETDAAPLLRYLRTRHPGVDFTVTHTEHGSIPLGFAPTETTGPGHVLLGTKRGLVKPSAGYGIVRIADESRRLARPWHENRPLPQSLQGAWRWRFLDEGFLQLAAHDARLPLKLLRRVMGLIPLAGSLQFINEELPSRQLATVFRSALPIVLGRR